MSPTLSVQEIPLTIAAMREIARQEGPAITLLIPDRHPGAKETPRSAVLRKLTQSVAAQGANSSELLQPLEDYASALTQDAGGPGVALFRSPTLFATLTVTGIKEPAVTAGRYFNLAPLVALASVPHDFYILALSRKKLRLYHYAAGHCEPAHLPAGVPADMAGPLEVSSQNRSSSGTSTGSLHAVQFGTSSEREDSGGHLHDFFQHVDRELRALLHETPLLLAGVHEEVAAYRRAARNSHVLAPEIHGNIDFLSPAEIAQRASGAALAHYRGLGKAVLERFQEMPDRLRTLSSVRAVLDAAEAGRVHQLCVAESNGTTAAAGEDLVNAAIVETFRHGGEVFMLPGEVMPEGIPVAAILRF